MKNYPACKEFKNDFMHLTLALLGVTLSSADYLCKKFGHRSGPTECRS